MSGMAAVGAGAAPGGTGAVGAAGEQQQHRDALKRIAGLRAEVEELQKEMDAPGMSQAKVYATKKKLQMKRAAAMREERALGKAQQGQR